MGDKPADHGKNEPSLELPSLFGRRKKSRNVPPATPVETPVTTPSDDEPTTRLRIDPEPTRPEPTEPVAHAEVTHRRAGEGFSLPTLPDRAVAIVTGLVVGAFGTLLTYLGLAGCEAVRGTSTCGGPGFFLLVAILALMILLGTLLLQAWKLNDPGSTSFLAVGLVTVVVLVALIEVIFSAWMFLALPIVSAAAYLLSHWVTTRFVDDADEGPPPHDVR